MEIFLDEFVLTEKFHSEFFIMDTGMGGCINIVNKTCGSWISKKGKYFLCWCSISLYLNDLHVL
jgi:hypothetical protein